jgi:hypothetical protein
MFLRLLLNRATSASLVASTSSNTYRRWLSLGLCRSSHRITNNLNLNNKMLVMACQSVLPDQHRTYATSTAADSLLDSDSEGDSGIGSGSDSDSDVGSSSSLTSNMDLLIDASDDDEDEGTYHLQHQQLIRSSALTAAGRC